jgi:hypothetical protein
MYQASEQFGDIILGDQRTFRAKISAYGKEETAISSICLRSKSTAEEYISIGDVVSGYVEIEMWAPEFSLENTEIEVSIGLVIDDAIEYVPVGLFTPQKPQSDDGFVTFTAYDRIQSKMSGAFFSELDYPADGRDVLQEISEKTGVPVDISNIPAGVMIPKRAVTSEAGVDDDGNEITNTTYTAPFDGYMYREALGYIAQFYGKFVTVSRTGTIVFRWYETVDYTIDTNRYYDDLVTNETVFSVSAITCQVEDTTLTSGSGTASIQIENPVMTQENLDAVYDQVKELQFLPASLSFLGDIRLDLGDIVTVNDKAGNVIKLPVMSITQDFDGGLLTTAQSYGRTEQEESASKGPTAQKIDRVYTELFLVKELVGNKANFDYVYGKVGEFETLRSNYAEFETTTTEKLNASSAQINSLSGQFSSFETQVTNELIAAKGWMLEGSIGDAQIQRLSANKIDSGTIDTAVVTVTGSDGHLQIVDNTIAISDANGIRVQVGKDASGDYTLAVWDATGNLIFDALGATENTIQRPIIRDAMVAEDANISGKKVDIKSVVTEINEGETRISQSSVQVGDKTLEVAFKEQTQSIQDTVEKLGESVYDVRILYASGDSDTTAPEEGWQSTSPPKEDGKYIWMKTVTTYGNEETEESEPTCISGADGKDGQDATLLKLESSRGMTFKNNSVSTDLSPIIYHGSKRIVDLDGLHEAYGPNAYLQWSWRRLDDDRYGIISAGDTRLSAGGFLFTVSPDDVDTQVTIMCELIV